MAQPTVATALSTTSTSNTRDISLVSELAETKQENERLREKIRRLRGAVAALTNEVASINDAKEEVEEVGIMRDSAEGDADGEESGSDVDGDDLALWDGDCFRCPECNLEVYEDCGICVGTCNRIWICRRDDGDEKVDNTDPILAETGLAMHPDRVLYPRGYSPVPLDQDLAEPTPIPLMYTRRADEFRALLARGASEQMYTPYGEEFMHDLLEEVLFCSVQRSGCPVWSRPSTADPEETDIEYLMENHYYPLLDHEMGVSMDTRQMHFLWEAGRDPASGAWITRPKVSQLRVFLDELQNISDVFENLNPELVFNSGDYLIRATQALNLPVLDESVDGLIHQDEYDRSDSDDDHEDSESETGLGDHPTSSIGLKRGAASVAPGGRKAKRVKLTDSVSDSGANTRDWLGTEGLIFPGFQDFDPEESDGGSYESEDSDSSSADSDFAPTSDEE